MSVDEWDTAEHLGGVVDLASVGPGAQTLVVAPIPRRRASRPASLQLARKVKGSFDCQADTTWTIIVPFLPNQDVTDLIC